MQRPRHLQALERLAAVLGLDTHREVGGHTLEALHTLIPIAHLWEALLQIGTRPVSLMFWSNIARVHVQSNPH